MDLTNSQERGYYEWLCSITGLTTEYSILLSKLYSTPFISINSRDENRESDGKELRDAYGIEKNESCSVLELMIGCAQRIEFFMTSYDIPDRTSLWFKKMLQSLGLDIYTNDIYDDTRVSAILNRFITRRYEPNGRGGLFTLRNPNDDLREVEIWYQLVWYVNEMIGD